MHNNFAYFDYLDARDRRTLQNSEEGQRARRGETLALLAICGFALGLMCLGGIAA